MKVAVMTATTHNLFDESHTGELLAGKPPEQFLWGGAGNGPAPCAVPRQSLTRQAMFQRLEAVLQSEIKTLGQPRAALFAFGVAVLAYNILSMLLTAVRVRHASTLEKAEFELSPYYIALEIRANYAGMLIATEAHEWKRYESLSTKEFAKTLLALATHVDPRYLRSYPRKPKVAKKKGYVSKRDAQRHVATSRVIAAGRIV